VVIAKDTPNFIANRIGRFRCWTLLRLMRTLGMTIEEVDACTGRPLGSQKSATFRTAGIVGIDVLAHVVKNIYESWGHDESREMYRVPALVEGWCGAAGWVTRLGRDFTRREGRRENAKF